jgi:hypothetical protein
MIARKRSVCGFKKAVGFLDDYGTYLERVQGSGTVVRVNFGFWGFGFRVQGSRFRV